MPVGKIQEALPVVAGDSVRAFPQVIAHRPRDRRSDWRRSVSWQSGRAEQFVDRARRAKREELTFRIGPAIPRRRGHVDGPRCDQRDQHVLIDGKRGGSIRIAGVASGEPERIAHDEVADRLAKISAREARAAFAAVVGDDHGKALIDGRRPERGLAEARMPHQRHASAVDLRHHAKSIEHAAHAPAPRRDGAPGRLGPAGQIEERLNACSAPVGPVGIEVVVAEGREGVAAPDHAFDRPTLGAKPARILHRATLRQRDLHPGRESESGKPDRRVGVHGVIPEEVRAEHGGRRPRAILRKIEQHVD